MIPNQRHTSETFTLCLTRAIRYKLHPSQWSKLEPFIKTLCGVWAQSCPALCDPKDCSLPGSSVHGIFSTIILEWIARLSSRESSWLDVQTCISFIAGLFFTSEPLGKLIETLFKPKSFLRCFTTCFVWKQIWKLNKEAVNSGIISITLRNPPKKHSSET